MGGIVLGHSLLGSLAPLAQLLASNCSPCSHGYTSTPLTHAWTCNDAIAYTCYKQFDRCPSLQSVFWKRLILRALPLPLPIFKKKNSLPLPLPKFFSKKICFRFHF